MRRSARAWGVVAALWGGVGVAAGCGDARVVAKPAPIPMASSAPSASASEVSDYAYPADDPVPQLRSGSVAPLDVKDPIASRIVARQASDMETLVVEVPITDEQASAIAQDYDRQIVVDVARSASDAAPYAFAERGADHDPPNPTAIFVWVRRPLAATGTPLRGDVYTPLRKGIWSSSGRATMPGMRLRFVADDARAPSDPKVWGQYLAALAKSFEGPQWGWHRGPWHAFAASRLTALAPKKPTPRPAGSAGPRTYYTPYPVATPPPQRAELARLMETTTGVTAIQEALQHERALVLAAARAKQTTAIATIEGPKLSPHPWKAMLARVKTTPAPEPLAAATPAQFWFARASDVRALLRVADQIATWGTPLANVMSNVSEDRDVMARYEAELGLRRGPLTERLGPSAIADMAIVGSDPYLVEGSDVTVVFRPKSRGMLDAALAGALASYEKEHGAIASDKRTHDGVDVTIARSSDGVVRQQRATVGDLEIVSNSAGALDRVVDAARGKRARLSDEPDFQYMLARDGSTRADVLAFFGDAFVAEVVGPRQKILELRRQIALAELATPGFAALLYGHVFGKSPASVAELTRAKLLDASELTHAGGGAIAWKPGGAARSTWGTPAMLTPLVDAPPVDKVSDDERAAYKRFVDTYQSAWKHYIDPVAIRVATEPTRLAVDVRELPLLDNSEYKDVIGLVGDSRIVPGKPESGAHAVFAIGEDSALRKELDRDTRSLLRRRDLSFDWIADWAAIGVVDRSALAASALAALDDELPQPPQQQRVRSRRMDERTAFAKLPIYVAIGVRSPVAAAIAIAAVRAFAEESAPGVLEWGEIARHRGVAITRVGVSAREDSFFGSEFDGLAGFYAMAGGALVVATSELVVRKVIDERVDGRGAKSSGEDPSGTQLAIDLGGDPGGALMTVMTWALEAATLDDGTRGGRAMADALLRGAPERAGDAAALRALALAYFGAVPTPPDGGAYTLAPDGCKDPWRGTLYAPTWPALPIDGSPVARIVQSLRRVHTELGFDEEPGSTQTRQLRSLHAKAVFDLR